MEILTICGVAVVSASLALMIRSASPHGAMLLSVASGSLMVLMLLRNVPELLGGISSLLTDGGIAGEDLSILIKVMGICFVTEFTCDTVTEAGMLSLSTNISFAGKILVLMTALPLFSRLLSVIEKLSGG